MQETSNELQQLQEEIVQLVANAPEIVAYQQTKAKVAGHQRLNKLTSDLKAKQKELVNAKAVQKAVLIAQLEQELAAIKEQMAAIPLYEQFAAASEEAQQLLDEVSELVNRLVHVSDAAIESE